MSLFLLKKTKMGKLLKFANGVLTATIWMDFDAGIYMYYSGYMYVFLD